jgi:membrane-bound lytic murein transglycosylase D
MRAASGIRNMPRQDDPPAPVLHLRSGTDDAGAVDVQFHSSFRIGRAKDCGVCIENRYVSRNHVEVAYESGQWWIRDLDSSNGVFVAGQKIQRAAVDGELTFTLGIAGPAVHLEVEAPASQSAGENTMIARYVERYFGKPVEGAAAGEHTMYVRRAIKQVQAKQRSNYLQVIAVLALLIATAGAYAWHEYRQLQSQKASAENLFYTMKSLDLDIANLERLVVDSNSTVAAEEIRKYRSRRKEVERSYDQFLANLHVYDPKMTTKERLVLRVARIFGESELAMPPDFANEVNRYIKRWQSSDRLNKAIQRAKANSYTATIAEDLLAEGLPPQFFYLALQESDFDPYTSGPLTRKGIAKGMWQFIPETAVKYGLHLGPLVDLRRPDPGDDRHHYEKATKAAAKYLKELYSTDAQASGILVMACYNWGEDNVLPIVRSMPANPRERNFWKLLSTHRDKIPQETYDYVFYIVSAAVIAEDPHLFGFNFDNPLGHLENK